MSLLQQHIINQDQQARSALRILDQLPDNVSRTLFIVDNDHALKGSLTDGDIRRGLLDGLEISQPIALFMNKNFKFIKEDGDNVEIIKKQRQADIKLLPVLNDAGTLLDIINLNKTKTVLPLTALLMAGGRGERLRPLTDNLPKPMLVVGEKPILEHNIDRLISYGIKVFYISVRYMKESIMNHFGDGTAKGIQIHYIIEDEPLGTLGAMAYMNDHIHEDCLVMNADILTNIDFEDFFAFYKNNAAEMALASIPYHVNIPYAVLETKQHEVVSFIEKPTYDYYSNGGIYIIKFALQKKINTGDFFNATDMMDIIINSQEYKLIHYPILTYWLDIGKHNDFLKAQEDIKHIRM